MTPNSPSAAGGAEVRLAGVTKRWGEATVVDRVDLSVAAGSFCVVLGPSGCGKTTCLRIIAGLDAPTEGRVTIAGRDVTALPPAARGVAMVFQSYALFPHLSVAENIAFGLRARGVPAAERRRRLDRAAEMLGLGKLLARRPAQLSGGQQQRVALGRAIVAEASVCLMDEPLSNLDALLRAEMRREILELQRRLGLTMIYVTHDQTEAMSMADRVVLMQGGRVEQAGTPAELYLHPATRFAASFIGQPPMNLLPLEPASDGFRLRGADGPALVRRRGGPPPVQAGLRPEALRPAASGIAVRLLHAEYLGAETVLSCDAAGHRLLARVPGRSHPAPGAALHLAFDPAELHLFGADGRRITFAAEETKRPQQEEAKP